ncbi:MAG: ABC transporter ATP-binding protein [Armatimonadota bacterium]|nr:ABC transporter ATP-binding protein [Armatimonadota bacterium]
MLEVSGISGGYGGLQVLWDVSLIVQRGELVALVGANGAGKSTLLKTIAGLLRPFKGHITLEGVRIDNMPPHAIVARGLALVPEGRRVFPYMTVAENLELGAFLETSRARIKEALEWVYTLFPILKERRSQLAGTLSGGEQQMLVIGRALMSRPRLLMMDEPSLGLAPAVVSTVFASIRRLLEEGITVLLVEQNVRKALELAHRGYVLENGRIVLSGASATLLSDPNVKKAYLGV